jgi:hypothetical protein
MVLPVGCGTSTSGICEDVCACDRCSESELEACVADLDAGFEPADDAGCGDQADALLSCWGEAFVCESNRTVIEGCDDEAEAYATCVEADFALFPNQSVCDRLRRARIAGGCGGGGEDRECSGASARDAACFLGAVADVCSATPQELDAYSDCIGA